MRQIKFRAWDNNSKEMFHNAEQGISFDDGSKYDFHQFIEPLSYDIHDWIVMQFTGLMDKNGKEIYEGDIVRLTDGGDVSHHRIYFDDKSCRWMDERLEDGDSLTCYDEFAFVKDAKIIGNIYENPDLLK